MSKKHAKDLFDDTTMTFGEHLEDLRVRLWKAVVGLTLVTCVTMYFGDQVMAVVRKPIEDALRARGQGTKITDEVSQMFSLQKAKDLWDGKPSAEPPPKPKVVEANADPKVITVTVNPVDLIDALHQFDPDRFPAAANPSVGSATGEKSAEKPTGKNTASSTGDKPSNAPKLIAIQVTAPEFEQLQKTVEMQQRPIVLTVQEGFMTWMKVSFVAGLVFSSPWVFYQVWLFIAAGLYPHERKYIHIYLPFSIFLFMGGAVFCFFCVFPFVLEFLLAFSDSLKFQTQIRIADWIDFAIMLPVMFGISFQLPLVMLFLERLSIFQVKDYREKRRIAILVITILSMILTPAEPYSMVMMMMPLIFLYEMGILVCHWFPKPKPFDDDEQEEPKKKAVAVTT